ncbi:MAG: sce7726 family protein [Porcipelethomonas sp.]
MLDPDIREALFMYLDENYEKHRTFEEVPIHTSRADIYAVTEHGLVGFEIKSDADSYSRLSMQIKNYDAYFDHNYVVVGRSHRKGVEKHIPEYWGIFCVYEDAEKVCVELVRPHGDNPKCRLKKQMELLWKRELCHILKLNFMPKYAQKSKKFIRTKLIEQVPEDFLKAQLYDELFERDYTLL